MEPVVVKTVSYFKVSAVMSKPCIGTGNKRIFFAGRKEKAKGKKQKAKRQVIFHS